MKKSCTYKGVFSVVFFFLIFLQKAKKPILPQYITLSCAPQHHFKNRKRKFEKKKNLHEKNIQCCNTIIGHQKKLLSCI